MRIAWIICAIAVGSTAGVAASRLDGDCVGLRATNDIHERRIEELESALNMATRTLVAVHEDSRVGKGLIDDLYRRHWIEGDDHDAQLDRVLDWAGIEPHPEDWRYKKAEKL